ncbi:MAG: DUF962 domain-containing protein [Thermaerobacter sp.]|nr:DUF962 domain-containing protein [Thermaerobacter sp.]
MRFRSFGEFWLYYLEQHRHPGTRLAHFFGTAGGLMVAVVALLTWHPLFVVIGLVIPYSASWFGHFRVEHNRPATFSHPIWSVRADLDLCRLMLTRGLSAELRKLKSS